MNVVDSGWWSTWKYVYTCTVMIYTCTLTNKRTHVYEFMCHIPHLGLVIEQNTDPCTHATLSTQYPWDCVSGEYQGSQVTSLPFVWFSPWPTWVIMGHVLNVLYSRENCGGLNWLCSTSHYVYIHVYMHVCSISGNLKSSCHGCLCKCTEKLLLLLYHAMAESGKWDLYSGTKMRISLEAQQMELFCSSSVQHSLAVEWYHSPTAA